jgi:hypothetical protein
MWLATAPVDRAGGYYSDRRLDVVHPQASSERLARQLWERSEELVGVALTGRA